MRQRSHGLHPLFGFTLLLAATLLLTGCAGMKPNPQYHRDRPDGKPAKTSPTPQRGKPSQEQRQPDKSPEVPRGAIGGDALDREVANWWGTPYQLGGSRRQLGVDCSAYVQSVYRAAYGIRLPRTTTEQWRMGNQIDKRSLRRGDLVFFNTSGRGVSHVGIYLGRNLFTHASNSDGVTINNLNDTYYAKRYLGARRVR